MDALQYRAFRGLSPRGRGKRARGYAFGLQSGSIPAWAGETDTMVQPLVEVRVYPRVGGGNAVKRGLYGAFYGLSPRGRGKPGIG